jgi:transcriptional regulator with GAF, ATPase, and Fis domain
VTTDLRLNLGAFTGVERDHEGFLEYKNGGNLFLDEIGDLPFEFQGKLLGVLKKMPYLYS